MCQITVADWVEPVGKPPFGTSDPSHCGLGCSHKKKKRPTRSTDMHRRTSTLGLCHGLVYQVLEQRRGCCWRVQNCDQTLFLIFFFVLVFFLFFCLELERRGALASHPVAIELLTPSSSLCSYSWTFPFTLCVCHVSVWVYVRFIIVVCLFSGLLFISFVHTQILCSNTRSTQDNLKGWHIGKKLKVYINICVYEMTKFSRFI